MKSIFTSFAIKLLIFVAVMATLINDGGSIVYSYYRVDDEARLVAKEALRTYRLSGNSSDKALIAAKTKAEQTGSILNGFQVTKDSIRISIEVPSKTTWVVHRIKPLKPYLSAQSQYDLPLNASL